MADKRSKKGERIASTYERSRVPLYLQVAGNLRQRILQGEWGPGEKISTLEELETEYEVARVTVRQALEVLQGESLLQRRQGKGTFVAASLKEPRWLHLDTSWESLLSPIEDVVPKMIEVHNPPTMPRFNEDDGGRPAKKYRFLRSLQARGTEPVSVVNVHLDEEIYRRCPDEFLTHTALSVLFALDDIEIRDAQQTMVIGAADAEVAALLKIALNAPTMEARCIVVDQRGIAIYVAQIFYRSDCVKLKIGLHRSH